MSNNLNGSHPWQAGDQVRVHFPDFYDVYAESCVFRARVERIDGSRIEVAYLFDDGVVETGWLDELADGEWLSRTLGVVVLVSAA
jgi:hypothetical protein